MPRGQKSEEGMARAKCLMWECVYYVQEAEQLEQSERCEAIVYEGLWQIKGGQIAQGRMTFTLRWKAWRALSIGETNLTYLLKRTDCCIENRLKCGRWEVGMLLL